MSVLQAALCFLWLTGWFWIHWRMAQDEYEWQRKRGFKGGRW